MPTDGNNCKGKEKQDTPKLCELLLEDLYKFDSVIWQFPLALISVNFLIIIQYFKNPGLNKTFNYVVALVVHSKLPLLSAAPEHRCYVLDIQNKYYQCTQLK